MTMTEVDEAAKIIADAADADANIIFGASLNDKMIDQMKITVIATGFDETRARLSNIVNRNRSQQPQMMGIVSEKKPVAQTPEPEPVQFAEKEETVLDSNPGDWDIPAFLRQKR